MLKEFASTILILFLIFGALRLANKFGWIDLAKHKREEIESQERFKRRGGSKLVALLILGLFVSFFLLLLLTMDPAENGRIWTVNPIKLQRAELPFGLIILVQASLSLWVARNWFISRKGKALYSVCVLLWPCVYWFAYQTGETNLGAVWLLSTWMVSLALIVAKAVQIGRPEV